MDQTRRGPKPHASRSFGLYRASWPRINGPLPVSDSGAFPYPTRQVESASRQETMARQSSSHEVFDRTVEGLTWRSTSVEGVQAEVDVSAVRGESPSVRLCGDSFKRTHLPGSCEPRGLTAGHLLAYTSADGPLPLLSIPISRSPLRPNRRQDFLSHTHP